jgi:hypothetical protein
LSTSKASPNDTGIVTVIIGKVEIMFHGGGIIAQFHVDFINFENQIAL